MKLLGVPDFDRPRLAEIIEANLADYFNWGLVQAGGFVDVPVVYPGTVDAYADSTFTAVSIEGETDYTIWKSPHPDWCHEHGLDGRDDPIQPDGVYLNGEFFTADVLPHRFDYRRGVIVFETPLLQNPLVQARYSYRRAAFLHTNEPWVRDVVLRGWEYEAAGDADALTILTENDVTTPCCVVEYGGSRKNAGVMLGSYARKGLHTLNVHVLAADRYDAKHLADVVTDQMGRDLPIYDLQARRRAADFELDSRGSPRPGASTYAQAVERYPYDVFILRSSRDTGPQALRSLYVNTATIEVETNRSDV